MNGKQIYDRKQTGNAIKGLVGMCDINSSGIESSAAAPLWHSLIIGFVLWAQPCPSLSFESKSNIALDRVGIGSTVSHDTATDDYTESILVAGDRVRYAFDREGNETILFSLDIAPDGSAVMRMDRKSVGSGGDHSVRVKIAAALASGRYQASYIPADLGGTGEERRDEPISIGGPAIEFHGTSTKIEVGKGKSLIIILGSDGYYIDFDLAWSQVDGFGFLKLSRSFGR